MANSDKLSAYLDGERKKRRAAASLKYSPAHPKWRGGPAESRQRRTESGAMAEATRRYRSANPDKAAEWQNSRRSAKIGRIVRGTVARLLADQAGKCAYCRAEIPPYHLDHKLPVSRGGTNADENLHLTCPRCNLRKHAMTHEEFLVSKKRRVAS